jgi:hypothetical protein
MSPPKTAHPPSSSTATNHAVHPLYPSRAQAGPSTADPDAVASEALVALAQAASADLKAQRGAKRSAAAAAAGGAGARGRADDSSGARGRRWGDGARLT